MYIAGFQQDHTVDYYRLFFLSDIATFDNW